MSDINRVEQESIDFSAELAARAGKSRNSKWARFTLAALSGIPWIGSFIGAFASLKAEAAQGEVNDLQRAWMDIHAQKIDELQGALASIVEVAEREGVEGEARLEDEPFLELVRQGFQVWDGATSKEKRERVRRTLSNAAVSKLVSDDLVRLFLSWIEQYDEIHFKIIGLLHRTTGLTRAAMWNAIDGRHVREDSRDADLFKMIIRDLSTGGVIRQHRDVTHGGEFLKKPNRASRGQGSTVMKSAFDDTDRYELTELGHLFVGYALDEPSTALPA
jgi:hypothetical protein